MSTLNVDKVDPSTGTDLELGTSGDTITVPTGAGLTVVDEVKTNKVSPATGTDFALGDSGDTFTVPSGATIVNSGTATGFGASLRPNVNPLIINGDMAVAQRGTSFAAEGEQYTLDRWYYEKNNDGVVTITQEALTADEAYEDGFSTAIKVDVTTADTSFTTNQRAYIEYTIEGQDLQLVKKGTANAEKLTLAFWVKATKTGTNVVRMDAFDTSRACSQAYTVSSTDTWEKKVLNFPADTTGVIDNDNGQGLRVAWGMGAGTNYTSGTLATTWEAYTDANTFVGQVNNFDSTSNNFHITGVQLEVGEYTSSTLPPFQHESFGDNFLRCCRYYQRSYEYGTAYASNTGNGAINYVEGVDNGRFFIPFRNGSMRAAPNMTIQRKNGGGTDQGQRNDFGSTYLDVDGISGKLNGVEFLQNGTQSGQGYTFVSQFLADAEL